MPIKIGPYPGICQDMTLPKRFGSWLWIRAFDYELPSISLFNYEHENLINCFKYSNQFW